ncbi:hypothetical protein DSM104299_01844 [Baekduia alba]|uniref:hypothetical protein n=1 Tax=Baekduia alba TaxID=2997333 RepID=UPI002340F2C0|nr:hypothetical protein [Baekduia alba]WCB93138.1 hypothetical protein DSM104299_01844 [Baekduia alba]
MPSTDAPNWWADVQQEREDLAGPGSRRPADDWLGEDIDFVPRRRMTSRAPIEERVEAADDRDRDGASHPLHGVFVPAADEPAGRTIELTMADDVVVAEAPAGVAHELAHLSAADDPFASPPPPAGARRTVQIKGRPTDLRMPSMAQRHRGRTASDRVGARPDRIALWAVALGAILILLAAMTSSSQAAVPHAAPAPAVHAKVTHVAPHAPLRTFQRHS